MGSDLVPVPGTPPPFIWDEGLSPVGLFSCYHKSSKFRHWTHADRVTVFLCGVVPVGHHLRGGQVHMDIQSGVCKRCIQKARTRDPSAWNDYVRQVFPSSFADREQFIVPDSDSTRPSSAQAPPRLSAPATP